MYVLYKMFQISTINQALTSLKAFFILILKDFFK